MQNLEFKQTAIDSRQVAEMLEKEHSKLLRDIETYSKYFTEAKIGLSDFFLKSQYIDSTGRTLPCYQITKKGCEFLAHKLTGAKGATFTAKYINAFDQMTSLIKNNAPVQLSCPQPQQDLMTQALLQILTTQNQILERLTMPQAPLQLTNNNIENSQNMKQQTKKTTPKPTKKRNNKCFIETLPQSVRKLVDTMITSGDYTYNDIQNSLKTMGYKLSHNAIYNYKKKFWM